MSIETKKPKMIETVGAHYFCFNVMDERNEWTQQYEEHVERARTVKSVKVSENTETEDTYASGEIYDSDTETATNTIEVEVVAFEDATLARMRGETISENGLILSGGNGPRPFFAYGKVVKLKKEGCRLEWYPKCKLTENTDEAETKESSPSAQTETVTITAYKFNESGDIKTKVSTEVKWPEGLTEEKFFSRPILTDTDLDAVVGQSKTE